MKNHVSKDSEVMLRRLINIIDADHDGVVKVETLQKIMDVIHEEGIEPLLSVEGDTSLNMVVEAIEREEMAQEAVSKKSKGKHKSADTSCSGPDGQTTHHSGK